MPGTGSGGAVTAARVRLADQLAQAFTVYPSLSGSIVELVGARVLQGIGGSMMVPVGRLIVGFTDIYTTKPAPVFEQKVLGVIENIYVLPEYRRLHIGEHLVHWARRFFENLRVGEIFVNVIPTNETSVVFWESMGFRTQKLSMTWKSPNLP